MSLSDAKRFLEVLKTDQPLQKKLAAAREPTEAVRLAVEVGAARGLSFTAEELQASVGPRPGDGANELSDDQLESVAGGVVALEYLALINFFVSAITGLGSEKRKV